VNYPLKRAFEKDGPMYASYGIELRPAENMMIFRDTAYRVSDTTTDTVLSRILRGWVDDVKKRRAEALQARQTKLL